MAADGNASDLSAFQMKVARLFFALPASRGFLLAGGAALLAQHLTARSTEDLDFFTALERGHVLAARDALEAAARQRGWSAQRSMTATHSAGWSSAAPMPRSWLTWP
jgi:hypothetical protein